jgi:ABC-type bacteriocin/lantibiotic exporter with double-glycine peptidase domain
MQKKIYKKIWVQQRDQADCGIACLATIINFYSGEFNLERIRELSGTTQRGTTLLGLFQAANTLGFKAEGCNADLENLKLIKTPTILHVLIDNVLHHYVCCFGYKNGHFIIIDPAKGLQFLKDDALNEIWKSKNLLHLIATDSIPKKEDGGNQMRRWFLDLIKEDKNHFAITVALGIAITVFSLSTAIFSQKLIDNILPSGEISKLLFGIFLLTLILLIKVGLNWLRGYLLVDQSKAFNIRIINNFYSKLLCLPKSFFDTRKTGDLIARMNDALRIQNAITLFIGNIIIDALIIIASVITFFAYNYIVGLLVLIFIPLFFLVYKIFRSDLVSQQTEVMIAYSNNESNYIDTITGISDIKALNKESFFGEVTKSLYGIFQNKVFQLGKLNVRYSLIVESLGTLITISVIGISAYFVLNREMEIGVMIALIALTGNMVPALDKLVISNVRLQEAIIAFERMYEFVSLDPEYEKDKLPSKQLDQFEELKINNISFRFPGRRKLLENVHLDLKRGEFIAILGESGAGKSTILQLIQKFYKIDNGSIKINSNDLEEYSTKSLRNKIGVIPQEIKIFNGTLLENICLGDVKNESSRIIKFCQDYGFHDYFVTFPQGYMTIVGEQGINLSGGQKQLVAFARVLYRNPELILLDEATSAMDNKIESFIFDMLDSLKKEKGILVVTHRLKVASKADRIYILENGFIKDFGSPLQLLSRSNSYSESHNELLHLFKV